MSRRAQVLVVAAIAAYAGATLLWVAGDERAERAAFESPGSSLDRGPEGTSLARGVLAERAGAGARVEPLLRRIDGQELPANAVVFRLAPPEAPFLGRWATDDDEKDENGDEKKDEPGGAKKDGAEKDGATSPKGDSKKSEKKGDPRGDGDEEGRDDPDEDGPARPSALLTDDEEAWVQRGGRLVIATGVWYGPLRVSDLPASARIAKVFPLWPGVRRIEPKPMRALAGVPLTLATRVFLAAEQPLVARFALGRGELIVLGCPEIFANDRIARGDHLALLEALAGPPGARPIFFDERLHGLERHPGTLALLTGWGFGPALLLALLGVAAAFRRARSPQGPPERDAADLRSDAVDLVDALAELYDRALRRVDALRLHHDNLVRTVAAETGLSGSGLAGRMNLLLPGFSPPEVGAPEISREELSRRLRIVNVAFGRIDVRDHKRRRSTG